MSSFPTHPHTIADTRTPWALTARTRSRCRHLDPHPHASITWPHLERPSHWHRQTRAALCCIEDEGLPFHRHDSCCISEGLDADAVIAFAACHGTVERRNAANIDCWKDWRGRGSVGVNRCVEERRGLTRTSPIHLRQIPSLPRADLRRPFTGLRYAHASASIPYAHPGALI
ncbi:hypothetical protein BV22DRAFT_834320 [Leucogyrophana mollusca]|uniref:Uncharacterized protein n=1 Tax=Leucogyrophana mollusca TaxID=85980 RepID=A0ACB8B359_9AGAM|nr:hypothetical protein BV22DRAFT_834320 [Leucogyrophana mollusca]